MASKRKAAAMAVQAPEEPVDPADELMFLCLGGGNEVGRSCHIIQYKGKTVMVGSSLCFFQVPRDVGANLVPPCSSTQDSTQPTMGLLLCPSSTTSTLAPSIFYLSASKPRRAIPRLPPSASVVRWRAVYPFPPTVNVEIPSGVVTVSRAILVFDGLWNRHWHAAATLRPPGVVLSLAFSHACSS